MMSLKHLLTTDPPKENDKSQTLTVGVGIAHEKVNDIFCRLYKEMIELLTAKRWSPTAKNTATGKESANRIALQ